MLYSSAICCHQRIFQSNIHPYTTKLENEIDERKSRHTEACIGDPIPIKIYDEKENSYMCKTY
jgi:hypothetical protein